MLTVFKWLIFKDVKTHDKSSAEYELHIIVLTTGKYKIDYYL